MDSLNFLYWSLGIGFALFIVFLCVALGYLISILRNFAKTTKTVKNTVEVMNENIAKVTDTVSDVAEQVADYVVKPVTIVHFLGDKIKPIIEMMMQQKGQMVDEEEETEAPKKKSRFGRKSK